MLFSNTSIRGLNKTASDIDYTSSIHCAILRQVDERSGFEPFEKQIIMHGIFDLIKDHLSIFFSLWFRGGEAASALFPFSLAGEEEALSLLLLRRVVVSDAPSVSMFCEVLVLGWVRRRWFW